MKTSGFYPKEVLFSLTSNCNLSCAHCDIKHDHKALGKKEAIKFLASCASAGIKRVGFTGGEPFLKLGLMCALSSEAVRLDMRFGRIATNGVWFKNKKELSSTLKRLLSAGYDGDISVSVDAFHRQNVQKCALFIKTATAIWRRHDIVSIIAVKGAKEAQTREKLAKLARILRGRLVGSKRRPVAIKSNDLFIKIYYIELSAIGKAAALKNPWDGRWFKDDLCKGPGNIFFVLPDGKVKPCCGYASDSDMLTIGSIKKDTPSKLIRNARRNQFVSSIFNRGLHYIRRRLEKVGVGFPGRTTNHCFFCDYLMRLPKRYL